MANQNGGTMEAVPGTKTEETFEGVSAMAIAETTSTAVAAQAQAQVQARYVMAIKKPRDLDDVRVRLLKECDRPRFAEVARYRKPVGGGAVEGPSIRFAEAALRCLGNVMPDASVVYDDAKKRIVRVMVTDLESNLTYSTDVTIAKTVERSSPKGQVLGTRVNSYGKTTYILEATEDDLLNKQAAHTSKALRGLALRILPGDILDEAMERVILTQEKRDKADPEGARKRLVDGFVGIGVKPSDLKQYLGHDLGQSSPAEMAELRAVYAAIRDGEGSWTEVLATKLKGRAEANGEAPKTVKDKVAAKAAAAKAKEPPSKPKVELDPETGEIVPPPGAGDAWEAPEA